MKNTLLLLGFLCPFIAFTQNVGIGTDTPDTSALLELKSTDKGMLVPRVALVSTIRSTPVTSPADALLIYNTATAGSGQSAVSPGFYYWNASTGRWKGMNSTNTSAENIGFGAWGDCGTNAVIGDYNPATASDGAANDNFGNSVSISGNYAIVGASGDDIGANVNQGSSYFYFFNGTTWVQQQKVTAPDGLAGNNFGTAVSMSGNYAVVSAPGCTINGNASQGALYIFFNNGSSWVYKQKLVANDGASSDGLGYKVGISGNYAIGSSFTDDIGTNTDQGSAYIFYNNGTSWVQQAKLVSSDGTAGEYFGVGAGISGYTAIVGAPAKTVNGNTNQGAAYIFSFNGTTWVQQQKLAVQDGEQGDYFGNSVSIDNNNALVGAKSDVIGTNPEQGSAYMYAYNGTTFVLQQKLVAADGTQYDSFGNNVWLSGNYAMVGVPQKNGVNGLATGTAYIYTSYNGLWQQLQKVTSPSASPYDLFGFWCGFDSKRFIISARGAGTSRGMVFFGKVN